MRPESRRQKRGVNAPASKMIHQEPGAWKLARPVLRGGKPVRVYLSRQELAEREIWDGTIGDGVEEL